MLTDRDSSILSHVKLYDGITIKQCENLFFSHSDFGYDLARKRLNRMVRDGFLKTYKQNASNLTIYYIDKKMSFSEVVLMNFYSELKKHNIEVISFIRKYTELDGKFTCDALCAYALNKKLYYLAVEICLSNFDYNFDRYITLYKSNIFQKEYGAFPKLVIISNFKRQINLPEIKVAQLNTKFDNLVSILVE